MKKCSKCNVEKHRSEFGVRSDRPHLLTAQCKDCRNLYIKAKRLKDKKKGHSVYYLPEEHYIGVTADITERMKTHRKRGKITEGYEILCYCERRVDAHYLETIFHMRGYNGFYI